MNNSESREREKESRFVDRLSLNFGNYQSTVRNIPEERRFHASAKARNHAKSNFML
jgi:hypothetical protein